MELQKNLHERVCAEIDMDAIVSNVHLLHERINHSCKMMAVIKTDAYGHGAIPIAKLLETYDFIHGFATATAEEALILRDAGICKEILVLGYTFPSAYEELIAREISMTIFREDTPEELNDASQKVGKKAKIHIKVDTGMNRIGIFPNQDGALFVQRVLSMPNLQTEGIFTHLATADEADTSKAERQIQLFSTFVEEVEHNNNIRIPIHHCSNSAGILALPQANMDVVRIGIAMYGIQPSEEVMKEDVNLLPALSLKSCIVYLKKVPKGTEISYGGTFVTKKETLIATIPVGYGDGYPRALSQIGYVLIRGKRAPILGRICMDQFMVDVSHIDGVSQGDTVVLIGKDREESIRIEELCDLYGGFHYELPCTLGKRIPRVYCHNHQ